MGLHFILTQVFINNQLTAGRRIKPEHASAVAVVKGLIALFVIRIYCAKRDCTILDRMTSSMRPDVADPCLPTPIPVP